MPQFKTPGDPSGTLKRKSTSKNINLLIELAEQSEKEPELVKAEVRMAVRIAKMLDIPVTYTTELTPAELWTPESPAKKAKRPKIASDPPADKPHPPKPE